MKISYPFIVTNNRLGRTLYPKKSGKILIYLADHSNFCEGNINKIIKELNITILHEIAHVFHNGRTKNNHDWRIP